MQELLGVGGEEGLEGMDEVRVGGYKATPVPPGGGHGGGQAGAVAGGQVYQGARGAGGAPGTRQWRRNQQVRYLPLSILAWMVAFLTSSWDPLKEVHSW